MESSRTTFRDEWGSGPWVVRTTCCGHHEGRYRFHSWKEADDFRESYIDAGGHRRTAIIEAAPHQGDAVSDAKPLTREEREAVVQRVSNVNGTITSKHWQDVLRYEATVCAVEAEVERLRAAIEPLSDLASKLIQSGWCKCSECRYSAGSHGYNIDTITDYAASVLEPTAAAKDPAWVERDDAARLAARTKVQS
jgi:hypothetical protein